MAAGPYSDTVMDHFTNPRNMGEIEDANGVGEVGNPSCGDVMKLYLKVNNDGVIENSTFKTFGCGAAIASSSMTTEMLKGAKVEDALKLTNQAIVDALGGLPPAKIHCSVMAEEAVEAYMEWKMELKEKVQQVLDKVRPGLQADGGDVELISIEDGVVKVALRGACGSCPFSLMTLKQGIEARIKEEIPEIKEVVSA